ncbi:AMP-binding protein [Kribbella antibiotica]|uniref:AMP-binding protein n=1 Tax=Kribbella antibiotica TaxID=190195 RepID=UPI001404567A
MNDPEYATLLLAVADHARVGNPNTIGACDDTESEYVDRTYSEVFAHTIGAARQLIAHGIQPGDAVGVDMTTGPDLPVAILAVLAAGAALVPLRGGLRDGFSDRDRAVAEHAVSIAGVRWCLAPRRRLPAYRSLGLTAWSIEGIASAPAAEDAQLPVPADPEATALIQFSSGSTAAPRGIVLTHGNLAANMQELSRRARMGSGARLFSWLPFSHDLGLVASFFGSLYGGTGFRAMPPEAFVRDPLRWLRELSAFRATISAGPPFGYLMVLQHAKRRAAELSGCDLSSIESLSIGSERVPAELCRVFPTAFAPIGLRPNVMLACYGLAENCAGVASPIPGSPLTVCTVDRAALAAGDFKLSEAADASAIVGHGVPLPGTELRIVDADGAVLAADRVGEIQISGASTAQQILREPGRAEPAGQDGFVATGDLGCFHQGELFVVGRIKELFKYAGRTFSPFEIETAVFRARIPGVTGVAMTPVRAENDATESVLIILELARKAGPDVARTVGATLLREFGVPVREVHQARPRGIPRTTSGKIQRAALAEAWLTGELTEKFGLRRIELTERTHL